VKRSQLLDRSLRVAARLFNRNPWIPGRLTLLPRDEAPFYAEDGLWTHHGHTFTEDERFSKAYRRAVEGGGFDYGIRWRVHTVLWAAEHGAALDGAFVECGTGRGFMASAICDYLGWTQRPFYLYDTFLPVVPDKYGNQTANGTASPVYAEGPESVAENFAEWPGVKLIVGKIPGTLLDTEPIAFLHVDLNHAAAEEAAVRHFWPKLIPGAPMIFDDYGFQGYEAQRAAADRLGRELGFRVLTLPTGQGLVLR
jgi:Methyltransferase domain